MTLPKIKVGVNKPRKGRIVPELIDSNRTARHVTLKQAQPVFRANKLLQFFWTLHPTKAAIDATYAWLKDRNRIRETTGSPVLPRGITTEEKLVAVREALGRSNQEVAFDK